MMKMMIIQRVNHLNKDKNNRKNRIRHVVGGSERDNDRPLRDPGYLLGIPSHM